VRRINKNAEFGSFLSRIIFSFLEKIFANFCQNIRKIFNHNSFIKDRGGLVTTVNILQKQLGTAGFCKWF